MCRFAPQIRHLSRRKFHHSTWNFSGRFCVAFIFRGTSGFFEVLEEFLEPKFWKDKICHLSFAIERGCLGRRTSTFGSPENYLLLGFWTTSTSSWSRNFGKIKFVIYHLQSKEGVSGGRLPLLVPLKIIYFWVFEPPRQVPGAEFLER